MYGLEKEKKKFDFDLEIEIKKKPENKKKVQEKIKKATNEIKTAIRNHEEEEKQGILLNAYDALEKVINKIK